MLGKGNKNRIGWLHGTHVIIDITSQYTKHKSVQFLVSGEDMEINSLVLISS